MPNSLTILEHQLAPLAPRFEAALAGLLPVPKLIQSVLISVERTPSLLDCTPDSILRAAMSAACLGLPIDGVTGQAFMIPFRDRGTPKAQLVVGYKGYNTLAARGGMTVAGAVVHEGDEFEYELGSAPFVRHRPLLGNSGRIVAAWATATHNERPPIVSILGIDDILAIKSRSPGAKRGDSPWNDNIVGFPAMSEKSAKRRLSRSMPMDYAPLRAYHMAAAMDEATEERGRAAVVTERGLEIDGKAERIGNYEPSETPAAAELTGPDVIAIARAKAAEGEDAFKEWYAGLSPADQKRVDAKRRPKQRKEI